MAEEDNNENDGTEEENDDGAVVKKTDEASGGDAKPAGLNPKIVYAVLLVNVLALLAVAFFVFSNNKKQSAEPTLADIKAESDSGAEEDSEKSSEVSFIKESFTVNLADADTQHFALVDIAIEVTNSFVKMELEQSKPKVRDFILVILSSKTLDEVSSKDGREFLREEIRNKINGYLTKGEVKSVLFEKFIIQ